ncbi:NAD(P)-dependent alcohol dehydrogenase [Caulobacter sp. SSI4214]|uniref:NAD(P)-dependent alcohol dehydrogenase n=1 Tax=Caulobacter sp. SSI4214 TaxID=2575739 RepID=UPI001438E633|nr:NAD(P)-dependent alcohol dehydrogenase [Caulobacter sp. SSI4214]
MTDIKAALTPCQGGAWEMGSVALDEPRGDEVLVRIVATGVCHTDISVRDQHLPVQLPAVLGHEGAGVIEQVGPDVTTLKPGDHVVLTMTHCGKCDQCVAGHTVYCDQIMPLNFGGRRQDGTATLTHEGHPISGCFFGQSSFATHALASERNAVRVPSDVDLALLGPLGCGIQTGAGTVINVLKPQMGSSIAIFGAGAVGLAAVMAAKVVGCTTIIAVDLHENRLQLARELGATHALKAGTDTVETIREVSGGGVHYAIDTTAAPAVIRQSVDVLRMRGRCILVGVPKPGAEMTLPVMNLLFGQSIGGALEGEATPKTFIPQMIALWRQGKFPFDKLIRFYDFDQINQAVADSESGATLKPVLRIGAV